MSCVPKYGLRCVRMNRHPVSSYHRSHLMVDLWLVLSHCLSHHNSGCMCNIMITKWRLHRFTYCIHLKVRVENCRHFTLPLPFPSLSHTFALALSRASIIENTKSRGSTGTTTHTMCRRFVLSLFSNLLIFILFFSVSETEAEYVSDVRMRRINYIFLLNGRRT